MCDGCIGVTQKHLGVLTNHTKVNKGEHSDTVIAADAGKNTVDSRICKGSHEVFCSFLRMLIDKLCALQGVGHFHNFQAKLFLQTASSLLVPPEDFCIAGTAPRSEER